MTRDLELIRSILLDLEAMPSGTTASAFKGPQYEGKAHREIAEHVWLLNNAGLIESINVSDMRGQPNSFVIKRLTWQGHEFIAKAKNDTVWKKVTAEAEQKGMSLSMTILEKLLSKAAEKYLGLDP